MSVRRLLTARLLPVESTTGVSMLIGLWVTMRGAWEPEGAKAVAEVARRAGHCRKLKKKREQKPCERGKMREETDVLEKS